MMKIGRSAIRRLRKWSVPGWETNHDLNRTVLLAGCGRSGTTWVAEILNAGERYRYIFEPFHSQKTKEWRDFEYHLYLPRTARNGQATQAAAAILSGKVRNAWIDSHNRTLLASRRLVKETRANLMLGWLRENFRQVPIVLLTRHPLAVAASRSRLGWGPAMSLDRIRAQPELIERHLLRHMRRIERVSSNPLAMQVISWCIEHVVPLAELKPDEYHLVVYEDLVQEFEQELARLLAYLGTTMSESHRSRYGVVSATASSKKGAKSEQLLFAWMKDHTADEMAESARLVQEFGLEHLIRPASRAGRVQLPAGR